MEALHWAACAGDIYSLQLKLKAEPRGRNFRCCLGMSSHHKGIYHAVIQKVFSAVEYNPRRLLLTHQRRTVWITTINPCWSSHHCWNFLPVMLCSQRTWSKIWVCTSVFKVTVEATVLGLPQEFKGLEQSMPGFTLEPQERKTTGSEATSGHWVVSRTFWSAEELFHIHSTYAEILSFLSFLCQIAFM